MVTKLLDPDSDSREMIKMVIELEDETDILQDSSRTLINIDDNERKIRRSVVAYLMWHSGHIFTADTTTDSKLRGTILDDYSVALSLIHISEPTRPERSGCGVVSV